MPKNNKRDYAIGVFDSGLGGLTVVRALMKRLPNEHIVYFGDTARVPYGTKSNESIIRFSKQNVRLLLKHKVKLIVVACNTSSSVALPSLKRNFGIPIMDVVNPGARRALEATKNKKIGVIATQATINNSAYTKKIIAQDKTAKVKAKACPLFVPLAEEGWFDKKVGADIAREYLKTIKAFGCDTVILGCTHYPLLKKMIQKVMGPKVTLVDSAESVAVLVKDFLEGHHMDRNRKGKARYKFLVSDEPAHFQVLAKRFMGKNIKNVKRVKDV